MLEKERHQEQQCEKHQSKEQPWKQETAEGSANTAASKNQEDAGREQWRRTKSAKLTSQPNPPKSETNMHRAT
jgi:hypothetical protein